jgi:hypothetical protein
MGDTGDTDDGAAGRRDDESRAARCGGREQDGGGGEEVDERGTEGRRGRDRGCGCRCGACSARVWVVVWWLGDLVRVDSCLWYIQGIMSSSREGETTELDRSVAGFPVNLRIQLMIQDVCIVLLFQC